MENVSVVGKGCCGCGACGAVCPRPCIEMAPDGAGFLRPVVDDGGCVGCGQCLQVCPALNRRGQDRALAAYWAKAKAPERLMAASSGGVFGLLAERTLESGGVVYGAVFDEGGLSVRHERISEAFELHRALRSKYVQSEIGTGIYTDVVEDLKAGRRVLFSGVPCQVSAMKGHVHRSGVNDEGLLCIDVACHGVPSPGLWGRWLAYLSESEGSPVASVNFRDKATGWERYSVTYGHASGSSNSIAHGDDWYMKAFLANASLRPSCFACPSKRSSGSDITLCDFWGVAAVHPEVDRSIGVSAVVANTRKGAQALGLLEEGLDFGESSFDEIGARNPALISCVMPHPRYEEFMADVVEDMDMGEMRTKWDFKRTFAQRVRRKLHALARVLS